MFLRPQNLGNVCILFAVFPCPGCIHNGVICKSKDFNCGCVDCVVISEQCRPSQQTRSLHMSMLKIEWEVHGRGFRPGCNAFTRIKMKL